MRTQAIQKALEQQGVVVAWRGNAPGSPSVLTLSYLTTNVDGIPRANAGEGSAPVSGVSIPQLKTDYRAALTELGTERNIKDIRAKCRSMILAVADADDQRNGLKREIRLERKQRQGGTLTAEQLVEEAQLIRRGDWIDEMKAASAAAIADSTPVDDVVWPEL